MKTSSPSQQPADLATVINAGGPGSTKKTRYALLALVAVILLGGGLWISRARAAKNQGPTYATEAVRRGDLGLTITATGNLEPTNEVTVGSELSGTILEVYVDINDRVTKGQPLAKLDTTKVAQQAESSRAALKAAHASVAQAEATVKETAATLSRQQELHRVSGGKLPSQSDLEAAEAAATRARATLLSAQASVAQAEAQLRINENDLGKAIIKSPIDGIVLTRSVEPGQTVAASLNAPELFVLAENLEHMKLKVTVAEADIGRVTAGLHSSFTVDAWPNRAYRASVSRVAYGSTTTNNVVTYETDLEVSNDDLSLRPGMTATADINVAEAKGVLLVPAAALRFDPASATPATTAVKKSFVQSLTPMPPRRQGSNKGDANAEKLPIGTGRLWVLRDGQPQAVSVKLGLTDGRYTEVAADGLTEGAPVILRLNSPAS
jgi:HlyD family secretion protein